MSQEMFDALLVLINAKITEALARNDWDGGLHETIRVTELEDEFRKEFVTQEE